MSVIQKIEEKALKYVESGLECPDFVFLSANLYSDLLKEMYSLSSSYPTPSRVTYVHLWTSVAKLNVKACSSWPNNSIIIGDHPILTVLQKLGGII